LTLHADIPHVLSNAICLYIFGTIVCRAFGDGVGCFLIISAGVVGNLTNAMVYVSDHRAVGASTAVFAAIGIMGTVRTIQYIRGGEKRPVKLYQPIVAVLGVLGVLGTGEGVDLLAHFFGALWGIILGLLYLKFRWKRNDSLQLLAIMISFFMIFIAWAAALSPS